MCEVTANVTEKYQILINTELRHLISRNMSPYEVDIRQFTNFVVKSLNDRKDVHTVYTDFLKTFDSIEDSILLNKVQSHGFPSTQLYNLSWLAIVPK